MENRKTPMPKCILVVDDEPVVVEIAKRKLEDRGYDVMAAYDGLEAFEAMAHRIPDLILLDVQMPRMSGHGFILEKAKNPAYAHVPVIVLTAYGEMEPVLKRLGVQTYLLKPLKLQDLLDKVQASLGG